ncbi:MAG: hypothetical protein NZ455_15990 [Bacteroidia bacterium]|nr:hypothetical protein [Bacteroidia bacterium]MDW8348171.1 hypothetical protein [Bacteroidia bacterium]
MLINSKNKRGKMHFAFIFITVVFNENSRVMVTVEIVTVSQNFLGVPLWAFRCAHAQKDTPKKIKID